MKSPFRSTPRRDHTRLALVDYQLAGQTATCDQVDAVCDQPHLHATVYGMSDDRKQWRVIPCSEAEEERRRLLSEMSGLRRQLSSTAGELVSYRAIMPRLVRIIASMDPPLRQLLIGLMSQVGPADSGMAARFIGQCYALTIHLVGEEITVETMAGPDPVARYTFRQGRLSSDLQTALLEHIKSVEKAARATGIVFTPTYPVTG
jgi:hypothetical protein